MLKTGRTHLQDAVPMTLGQEFGGFAANIAHAAKEVDRSSRQLLELNLGSTAVGTGLNAGNDYTDPRHRQSRRLYWLPVRPAVNRFRVTQSMGDVLGYSGALRRLAAEVGKIASDLRLLSMGPRAGIAETEAAGGAAGLLDHAGQGQSVGARDGQPGLLPGVRLRCHDPRGRRGRPARIERDDAGDCLERDSRHAHPAQAMIVLQERCVAGIEADEARCRELLDRSTAVATALSPYIGYAATADIAKTAVKTGKSIARAGARARPRCRTTSWNGYCPPRR